MLMTRTLLLVGLFLACPSAFPQDHPATPAPSSTAEKPASQPKPLAQAHKFWDTENICLFAGVGAVRMLDYASTRHLRDQGDNEWLLTNSIVDNEALFVGIELAGTAASIGVSYLFHHYGHHSLERWVSIIHIGVGVGGSIHNYLLTPAPPAPQPLIPGFTIRPSR